MKLLRALSSEAIKLKRTIALRMILIAPASVVLLTLFLTSQAPFSMLQRNGITNEWIGLAHLNLMIWAFLMMPLYITLETSLLSGLDHTENQWKSLMARPVPRWTLYVAKLLFVIFMTVISSAILVGGVLVSGFILPLLHSGFHFKPPVPFAAICRDSAQVTALAFLALAIQHWVSLRWRAFSVSMGAGIVAMVVGYFAVVASFESGTWPKYFPWALPMLVLAQHPGNIDKVLLVSNLVALGITILGCYEFCRREIM
jgi:lantibiotic transport system permease protein